MSKITFRADDDLVRRLEAMEASKSEVMRAALRAYLDGDAPAADERDVERLVHDRVDELLADRLDETGSVGRTTERVPPDVNLSITIADGTADATVESEPESTDSDATPANESASSGPAGKRHSCNQCGEPLEGDHVHCPNCGEKATRRVFCECGDELRSDWSFCPACGRRTPAADVLDRH